MDGIQHGGFQIAAYAADASTARGRYCEPDPRRRQYFDLPTAESMQSGYGQRH
jgi:hypothetical protein